MYISNLVYSPFLLSLVVPSVFSLPQVWKIVTREIDVRGDGGCIVFVNARDEKRSPVRSCNEPQNTVRDLPTTVENNIVGSPTAMDADRLAENQIPIAAPTDIAALDAVFDEPAISHWQGADSETSQEDGDAPVVISHSGLTPSINARDVHDQTRDVAAIIARNCQGPDPVEPIDASNTTVTPRGTDNCPYVNARDAGPPPYVNAREAGPPPYVNARTAGEPPYVNAREAGPPPYVNAREAEPEAEANLAGRTEPFLEDSRR